MYQEREMAMMSRGRTCWQLASAALCQAASASSENATAKRAERTVMVRKPAASTCAATAPQDKFFHRTQYMKTGKTKVTGLIVR